eukprot:SM000005S17340  [mRNA]  locus=s5:1484628:1485875:- [translate_table: standard]
MTITWRRSPGAQPPHQQHVRRFGGNVRQRSASSALRLPQGGSSGGTRTRKRKATATTAGGCHKRCTAYAEGIAGTPPNKPAMSGWTGVQLHRRFLNSSKEHCRSSRRLDRPSVAPPILELKQRALPLSQVLLHALCRQFASFAGVPSHMPVANMEQEGIVIALLVVLMMFIFLDVNIALDEELTLLIWEQERKASEHQAKRRRLWSYERSTTYANTLMHGYDEGLFKSRVTTHLPNTMSKPGALITTP